EITIRQFFGSLTGLALQGDGQILAAGLKSDLVGDLFGLVVARLTPVGALDTTFGMQGSVTSNPTALRTQSVVVQDSGRIIVGGTIGNSSPHRFVLDAFTDSGSPDPSFGTGGEVTTTPTGNVGSVVAAVLLQPDGEIVAVGSSHGAVVLARYGQDGKLEATSESPVVHPTALNGFGAISSLGAILQPDGKILVIESGTPSVTSTVALVRFNPDGSLDPSFGSGGAVGMIAGLSFAHLVRLQSDGKILVAGGVSTGTGTIPALIRLNADGIADPSFTADFSAL